MRRTTRNDDKKLGDDELLLDERPSSTHSAAEADIANATQELEQKPDAVVTYGLIPDTSHREESKEHEKQAKSESMPNADGLRPKQSAAADLPEATAPSDTGALSAFFITCMIACRIILLYLYSIERFLLGNHVNDLPYL